MKRGKEARVRDRWMRWQNKGIEITTGGRERESGC